MNGICSRLIYRNLQNFDDFMQKSKSDWPDEVRAKPAKPLFKPARVHKLMQQGAAAIVALLQQWMVGPRELVIWT